MVVASASPMPRSFALCRVYLGWGSAAAVPAFASAHANEDPVGMLTTGEWRREHGAPPVVPVFAQCAAVGDELRPTMTLDPRASAGAGH